MNNKKRSRCVLWAPIINKHVALKHKSRSAVSSVVTALVTVTSRSGRLVFDSVQKGQTAAVAIHPSHTLLSSVGPETSLYNRRFVFHRHTNCTSASVRPRLFTEWRGPRTNPSLIKAKTVKQPWNGSDKTPLGAEFLSAHSYFCSTKEP